MSAVAEKLREARKLLADGGWIQRAFSDRCGGHCAAGALLEALADSEDEEGRSEVFRALFRAIPRVRSSPTLFVWNDAQRRTKADVLAAFDKAIALAEAEQ